MKYLNNKKGIALVLTMILSVICLAIVLGLIYFITQSTESSGFNKRYQTAQEAAKGGVGAFPSDILPGVLSQVVPTYLSMAYPSSSGQTAPNQCIYEKLTLEPYDKITRAWQWTNCPANAQTLDPKTATDVQFMLKDANAEPAFTVFIKVVDTVAGNTDMSGLGLEGLGVTESGAITPQHLPFIYRVELQAERSANPDERANYSVLYTY